MLKKLNAWQKFWGLFAVVFFASTLALIATAWPRRDPAVVSDLGSPECRAWTVIGEADLPAFQPGPGEPCYALRSFLYHERTVIRSESEYDRYRFGAGLKKGLTFLAIWAGFMGSVYLLGVAGVAAMRVLTRSKRPRTGS